MTDATITPTKRWGVSYFWRFIITILILIAIDKALDNQSTFTEYVTWAGFWAVLNALWEIRRAIG